MVNLDYKEVYDQNWIRENLKNTQHELIILRQIIPWMEIVHHLKQYYSEKKGRTGLNLYMMVGILLLGKIRVLSDEKTLDLVLENEYARYFCHVAPRDMILCDRTALVHFRKRIGVEGVQFIENAVFSKLRKAGVIENDMALLDSSVLNSNILYPNDVDLLKKAIDQITMIFKKEDWSIIWNQSEVKKHWKDFNLGKKRIERFFLKPSFLYLMTFFLHLEFFVFCMMRQKNILLK